MHIKHYKRRNLCNVFVLLTTLYAQCLYFVLLYMQSVPIIYCFVYKVSILFTALYATCPCYLLLYMQSFRIIYCLICKVSLLCSALYAGAAGRPAPRSARGGTAIARRFQEGPAREGHQVMSPPRGPMGRGSTLVGGWVVGFIC